MEMVCRGSGLRSRGAQNPLRGSSSGRHREPRTAETAELARLTSGARGGFCCRRGRTTDATADGSAPDARSTYAVLAYASTCTTAW